MGMLRMMTLVLAAAFASAALAQPRHGGGQGQGHGRDERAGGGGAAPVFADRDRTTILGFYQQQFASGNCPPGLAKKGNGCLPPGKARQWVVGQRLPAGLITYPLPAELLLRLAPPAGHTYVRVGGDILMIAIGTGMVASGIQNLLR